MENPFRFSGIVEDPAFCNRKEELVELRRYVESSQNVLLYSHRRYGKSSLLIKLLNELDSIRPIYVDLYGTTSPQEFISAFLSGLCSLESRIDRLMKSIRNNLLSVRVSFSIDPVTGLPTMSPAFDGEVQDRTISELFALVESFSKKSRLVVVFDEFQEIAGYEEESFEKQLRKNIQTHDRISYVFAGSQRHILIEMFNNSKRAFYQLATSYPLGKIETVHYVEWIKRLFRLAERNIEKSAIEEVVNQCRNHPRYVQEFFHELWTEEKIDFEAIERMERKVLTKRVSEFAYMWDSMSLNQKRTLKLLAATSSKSIFSANNLSRFGFRTASQVTAALSALQKTGVIGKNDVWIIHDPFFEKWLRPNNGNVRLVTVAEK